MVRDVRESDAKAPPERLRLALFLTPASSVFIVFLYIGFPGFCQRVELLFCC